MNTFFILFFEKKLAKNWGGVKRKRSFFLFMKKFFSRGIFAKRGALWGFLATLFLAPMLSVSAADTISSSQYLDTDGDGTVDTIRWTFDETITTCNYESGDWSIDTAGDINVTAITGITCSGSDVDIAVTADADKTGGATDPAISYTDQGTTGSLMGAAAITDKSSVAATDGAAPFLLSFSSTTPDGTYGPGSNINVTATYTETVSSGSAVDVTLDTGASLTLSSISGATVSGAYTVGATGSGENTTDLTVSSITSQSVSDGANTNSGTSLPSSNIADTSNIVADTIAPTFESATTKSATEVEVVFSEGLSSATKSDFGIGANSSGNNIDSGTRYNTGTVTFTLSTPIGTDETPTVYFDSTFSSGVTDAAGNPMATASIFTTDGASPTVTINPKSGQASPTNTSPVFFTVVFSEPINTSTFDASDISTSSSTATGVSVVSVNDSGDHKTFEISISATGDGDILAAIPANVVSDLSGNLNEASALSAPVAYDVTAPSSPLSAPDLETSFDTGISNYDDLTFHTELAIIGQCTNGNVVTLYEGASVIAPTAICASNAFNIISDTLTEGVHNITFTETDPAGNESGQSPALSVTIDKTAPTLTSATISNGTPSQVALVFDEPVSITDATEWSATANGIAKTFSSVSGSGTTNITLSLSTGDAFQAGEIVKIFYNGSTGNTTDIPENPLADISNFDVTNNIEEKSPLLTDILLKSDTNHPSSAATITWNTKANVNGVPTNDLNTTGNLVEYGTTMTLGSAQATSTGDGASSHSASLTGLSPNTVYYYRVKSVANGKTSYSQIFSFTTARGDNGLYTDEIVLVKSTAKYDTTNPWTNGWHFRFEMTADNITERYLRGKFDNWVSGTNTLATNGNMKMIVSSSGVTADEATIAAATDVKTTYADGTTVDLNGIADNNPNKAGKQFVIDVYVKIPDGQPAGTYGTSYGFENKSTDASW